MQILLPSCKASNRLLRVGSPRIGLSKIYKAYSGTKIKIIKLLCLERKIIAPISFPSETRTRWMAGVLASFVHYQSNLDK